MFLSDVVKGGQSQALTGSDYIQERRYKSIVKWQVKEVTVTGGQPNNAMQSPTGTPTGVRGQS